MQTFRVHCLLRKNPFVENPDSVVKEVEAENWIYATVNPQVLGIQMENNGVKRTEFPYSVFKVEDENGVVIATLEDHVWVER